MLTWRSSALQHFVEHEEQGRRFSPTLLRLEVIAASLASPLQLHGALGLLDIGDSLLLYKQQGSGLRLFARCLSVHESPVLAFLECLDHDTYDRMNRDRDQRNQRFEGLIDHGGLNALVQSQRDMGLERRLPELPLTRAGWIQPPSSLLSLFVDRAMVAESQRWLDALRFADEATRDQLRKLAIKTEGLEPLDTLQRVDDGVSEVSARSLRLTDGTTITALEGVHAVDAEDRGVVATVDGRTLDDVARSSARTYPRARLKEEVAWLANVDAEAFEDPSLPLSMEELGILDRFAAVSDHLSYGTSEAASDRALPLFLDGPAGSGKSTLLGFLAAGLIHAARPAGTGPGGDVGAEPGRDGGVAFLTYSDGLTKASRRRIQRILSFHFGYTSEKAERIAESTCQTTRDLFRSLLPPEQRQAFTSTKPVSFGDFRRFMRAKVSRSAEVDPEVAWFVIRTFIKGFAAPVPPTQFGPDAVPHVSAPNQASAVTYFEAAEFAGLPEQRRDRIELPQFEEIERRVFPQYLAWQAEYGRWDDQDLAHAALPYALADGSSPPSWMAIICDEAQDLTKAELRVLFRLLGATHYDLSGYHGRVILPMVFAADPGQTVNPSGFTWASFTSSFFDETSLLFGAEHAVGESETHLRYNYRSQRAPIAVSDAIQAWRKAQLQRGFTRTIPWLTAEGAVWRHLCGPTDGSDDTSDEMAAALRGALAVIVPCHEGSEVEFVEDDEFLAFVFADELRTGELPTVFSPASAKGLEWDRVALYGFGRRFSEVWHTGGRAHGHRATRKETDYVLNGLYVAATRAQRSLHFFDRPDDDSGLWGEHGLGGHADPVPLVDLRGDALKDLQSTPKERRFEARRAHQRAMDNRDPAEFRRAAALYRAAEVPDAADRSLAWAALLEAEPTRRPETLARFVGLEAIEELERVLWADQDWPLLCELSLDDEAPDHSVVRRLSARLLSGQVLSSGQMTMFGRAVDRLDGHLPAGPDSEQALAIFVQQAADSARGAGQDPLDPVDWERIAAACYTLGTDPDVHVPQAWEAYAWALAAAGEERAARTVTKSLDLTTGEREALDAQLIRTATGLPFADDGLLLRAAARVDDAAGDDEEETVEDLVALTIAALDGLGSMRQARMALRHLPRSPEASAALTTTLLLDVLEERATLLSQLTDVVQQLVDPDPRSFAIRRTEEP